MGKKVGVRSDLQQLRRQSKFFPTPSSSSANGGRLIGVEVEVAGLLLLGEVSDGVFDMGEVWDGAARA